MPARLRRLSSQDHSPRTGGIAMTQEIDVTLRWGVEVERALLAILWWHAYLIGLVRRELDPNIHLTLPKHRYILEAIEIAFREIGDVTWETVVQVILEIPKAFEE